LSERDQNKKYEVTMKKAAIFSLILLGLFLTGCKDIPSSSMMDKEFDKVRGTVKSLLGEEYEAVNFRVTKEGYAGDQKTEYEVEYKFDLNKPVPLVGVQKDIPGALKFEKGEKGWECTLNTGNALEFFNLMK
jgi:hypothetical protein